MPITAIHDTIGAAFGSAYVNDFILAGRVKRVTVAVLIDNMRQVGADGKALDGVKVVSQMEPKLGMASLRAGQLDLWRAPPEEALTILERDPSDGVKVVRGRLPGRSALA